MLIGKSTKHITRNVPLCFRLGFIASLVFFLSGSSHPQDTAGTVKKNSLGMELVYIPSGSFMMGSHTDEKWRADNEGPQHSVTIGYDFWIGKYEVTQEEYKAVMAVNPSGFKNCQRCPVDQVSWDDAKKYIQKLNARNDGYEYRLPTEAEWEYAARSGTTTIFAFGNSLSSSQANFNGNFPYGNVSEGEYKKRTVPVGSYKPNAWGLYDMHGNVYEWVEDIYNESGYKGLPTDGSANINKGDSTERVLRGGSWDDDGYFLRSAYRNLASTSDRFNIFGFRVVARLKTASTISSRF